MNLMNPRDEAIELTEHGIKIRRLLDYDDWKSTLKQLRKAHSLYHSCLADVIAYGRKTFDDELVNEALEQLQFDFADAIKAEKIGLVGHDIRQEFGLSSEHAYVLGNAFPDDEDQRKEWASTCHKEGLTAFELKKSIAAGKVMREAEIKEQSGHTGGLPSLQSVRYHFERWTRTVKDPEEILKLPDDQKAQMLEMLSPIIELAAKLESAIKGEIQEPEQNDPEEEEEPEQEPEGPEQEEESDPPSGKGGRGKGKKK